MVMSLCSGLHLGLLAQVIVTSLTEHRLPFKRRLQSLGSWERQCLLYYLVETDHHPRLRKQQCVSRTGSLSPSHTWDASVSRTSQFSLTCLTLKNMFFPLLWLLIPKPEKPRRDTAWSQWHSPSLACIALYG